MPARAPARPAPARASARRSGSTAPTNARGRGGAPTGGPAVKLSGKAAQDPRLKNTIDQLENAATRARRHDPAGQKADEAQAAAQAPTNERAAGAQANQVGSMQDAPTGKPDRDSFLTLLRAEIQKAMPKKTEDAAKFMDGDDRSRLSGAMTSNVQQQQNTASAGLQDATRQAPDPSSVPATPVTPLPNDPAPALPANVNAANAMPQTHTENEVSLEQGRREAQQSVTDIPTDLRKANDPRFSAVMSANAQVERQASSGPQQFRSSENQTLNQARTQASHEERRGINGLSTTRRGSNSNVRTKQMTAKERSEAKRQEVVTHIQNIYERTKSRVESKLSTLEGRVSTLFDQGSEKAIARMKRYVETRFDDRYSGVSGKILWAKDKLVPLPDEVKAWFDQAHQQFTSDLDAVVVNVANLVETSLEEAKAEIQRGQNEIKTYVASLPANLRSVGQNAEQEMTSRFNQLRESVDAKKQELASSLTQKYQEALEKGDKALQDMKNAHKSLAEKLADAVGEVIKLITEFKDKLMSALRKGWDTIKLILADPIGFLGNLLNAIKGGIQAFVANIGTHLKNGFMNWLFGALGGSGIEIPKDLSLPSILKLVLQVLGITYDKMRAKAVKLIGERNVKLLEKLAEYLRTLLTGGIGALWEKVKEDLGSLKAMVIDAIQSWLIDTIIKQAVTKLVSMFNPAGAIIQAVITIYNTVMFLWERAQQILAFIEAVINSVNAIATGAIGSAITWIESALARMVPLVIGFLARLIGLGGISQKIKDFIFKVQFTVDKAIDKAIAGVVKTVKKLFGGGKDGKPDERTDAEKQSDVDRAVVAATPLIENKELSLEEISQQLGSIKNQYKLSVLEIRKESGNEAEESDYIAAEINPKGKTKTIKRKLRFVPAAEVTFVCPPDFVADGLKEEFDQQVKGQEAGLNKLKLTDWETNIRRYAKIGRSAEGSKKQREFRDQERLKLIEEEMNQGSNRKNAVKIVEAFMKTQAALHDPDQIAGGDPTKIKALGNRRANSSLGAQWRNKAEPFIKDIKARVKDIPQKTRSKLYLNVKLISK